jgi:hypothetical protein
MVMHTLLFANPKRMDYSRSKYFGKMTLYGSFWSFEVGRVAVKVVLGIFDGAMGLRCNMTTRSIWPWYMHLYHHTCSIYTREPSWISVVLLLQFALILHCLNLFRWFMRFPIKSLVLVLNSLEAENLLLHILMCRDLQGLNQFERKNTTEAIIHLREHH